MCKNGPGVVSDRRPEDLLADLIIQDLQVGYQIPGHLVATMIFRRWGALTTLAHAIHDNDRRKVGRDRRKSS